jgi:hypothetical protein
MAPGCNAERVKNSTAIRPQDEARGRISGVVRDKAGAVIAGASLSLEVKKCFCEKCPDQKACDCCPPRRTITSDDSGMYEFSIPPGMYKLTAKYGDAESEFEVDIQDKSNVSRDITLPG